MNSAELQKKQEEYDKKYWQIHGEFEKIRHITLHIGKLVGKLSTYCEAREHGTEVSNAQIRNEIIPDLQVYAFQLANLLGENAGECYLRRLEELTAHYTHEEHAAEHLRRITARHTKTAAPPPELREKRGY